MHEQKYGKLGEVVHHTLFEDGTVTHYNATFTSCGQEYIVNNVPINRMTDIVYEGHSHMPMKKKKGKK